MHSFTSNFTRYLRMKTSTKDPRRSTNCWNVDRRQSEKEVPPEKGGRKILHDEPVFDIADGVCDIVRGSAIEGVLLAERDGVRRTQRTRRKAWSPHLHHPASGHPHYLASSWCSQAHEHETSRVEIVIDTTSGQLIVDLIAKDRMQILVPREHPPRPGFSTRG